MSTLTLKELSAPAGEVIKIAAGKTLDLKSQGSVTMPTGSVLQVVSATFSAEGTTTSTSWTSTGMSLAITPSSTTSKILVNCAPSVYVDRIGSSENLGHASIHRNSTLITATTKGVRTYDRGGSGIQGWDNMSIVYLDSPSSTSAVTYELKVAANQTSSNISWNAADGGQSYSSITLMEIQG